MADIWFFFADIINEFKVFNMPVPLYAVMGQVMLLFGLQEIFFKRLEIKRKYLTDAEIHESKTFKIIYIPAWIFVICLLLGIPLDWWGVIKKTITEAG